jgi:hypothetical protein
MMHRTGKGPRAEHHEQQRQRVADAGTLAQTYPQLKSLKVQLEYADAEGHGKAREMKFSANVEHAKAVLMFACPNAECIGGDFDLSKELARAIAGRRVVVTGELPCPGSRKKPSKETVPCRSVLRYTLKLAYVTRSRK